MGEFELVPRDTLKELIKKVDELHSIVTMNAGRSRALGDWIPESEARALLNLKSTSMWALRKRKKVQWKKIGRQVYYYRPSLENMEA